MEGAGAWKAERERPNQNSTTAVDLPVLLIELFLQNGWDYRV